MIDSILGILLVISIFILLLQGLSQYQKTGRPHQELVRKALHLIMGSLTLTFPWLFHAVWPVLVLAVSSAAFLTMLKYSGEGFPWHNVACRSNRRSYGELVFPLAVGLLFWLSNRDPLLFCIPMLVLTFADTVSALVGMRYGKKKYDTADGTKTTEGSFAFFTVAFLGTHIPLLLFTHVGRFESLTIALIIGILGMMFEGIAWRGLDNLFIPLGTYVVLRTHLHASELDLVVRLIVISCILTFAIIWRHKTTLNGGAILGVALYSYYSWVLGGLTWVVLPLIMFACYRQLLPQRFHDLQNKHSVYGVISVASTGVLWLFCAAQLGSNQFLYPYALAFAVHASIITIAHMRTAPLNKPRSYVLLRSVIQSWCLIFAPVVILQGLDGTLLLELFAAPIIIAAATLVFYLTKPQHDHQYTLNTNWNRWMRQAALAAAGSLLGLLPCFSLAH